MENDKTKLTQDWVKSNTKAPKFRFCTPTMSVSFKTYEEMEEAARLYIIKVFKKDII